MRKTALLVDMRIDQMSDFVSSLLRLSCSSTSENDNVIMNKIDLISDSVYGVNSSWWGALIIEKVRESAQAITPPSYLIAMIVVPIVSFG